MTGKNLDPQTMSVIDTIFRQDIRFATTDGWTLRPTARAHDGISEQDLKSLVVNLNSDAPPEVRRNIANRANAVPSKTVTAQMTASQARKYVKCAASVTAAFVPAYKGYKAIKALGGVAMTIQLLWGASTMSDFV